MTIDPNFFTGRSLHGPDNSLGFVLWRVTHAWQRFLEQRLIPLGLTHLRWALLIGLGWLTREGGEVSQRHLADFLAMQPMQVSQVLVAMEKADLVMRRASVSDGRAFALALTPAGEKLLRRAMPVVEAAHGSFFGKQAFAAEGLRAQLLALLA